MYSTDFTIAILIQIATQFCCFLLSPSTRRVWIEIDQLSPHLQPVPVTLHTEGVDRNDPIGVPTTYKVPLSPSTRRVWIEISSASHTFFRKTSPSTRRVWIEITTPRFVFPIQKSPSTRRVWIEIIKLSKDNSPESVTLHTEGVDRNIKG